MSLTWITDKVCGFLTIQPTKKKQSVQAQLEKRALDEQIQQDALFSIESSPDYYDWHIDKLTMQSRQLPLA